jgi:hypothetical protein
VTVAAVVGVTVVGVTVVGVTVVGVTVVGTVTGTVGAVATGAVLAGALVLGVGVASLDPPPQADNKLRQVMAAAGKNKCVMGRSRSRGCGRVVPRAWAKSEVVENNTVKKPWLGYSCLLHQC